MGYFSEKEDIYGCRLSLVGYSVVTTLTRHLKCASGPTTISWDACTSTQLLAILGECNAIVKT